MTQDAVAALLVAVECETCHATVSLRTTTFTTPLPDSTLGETRQQMDAEWRHAWDKHVAETGHRAYRLTRTESGWRRKVQEGEAEGGEP